MTRNEWLPDAAGWCAAAERVISPNQDARPAGMPLELLVIHNISLPAGQFGTPHVSALFCNQLDCSADPSFAGLQGLTVSSHFLIARDGRVTQFVPCLARAWHAGLSEWQGRSRCNDFSIGIELEGCDWLPFAAAQYDSLQQLTAALLRAYPSLRAIAGHQHIAPQRKTDPGPHFDWAAYRRALQHHNQEPLQWGDLPLPTK